MTTRPLVKLTEKEWQGQVVKLARSLGRHATGIELNTEYLQIAATRLQQLSLLGGHT